MILRSYRFKPQYKLEDLKPGIVHIGIGIFFSQDSPRTLP